MFDLLTLAEGGANPFEGSLYQAGAAAFVFLTLLYVLKAKAWGPILQGLQDRENKIKGDLDQAEAAAREATEKLDQYNTQLAQAQAESARVIEQARNDAQRLASQLKDQAQTDIIAMRDRAQGEIAAAKEQAISDIYDQTATLATQVAGRILQREINVADQQQLVDESLAQLKQSQN
jgi:F-type H+-transporting ATPase subunit b